MPVTAVWLDVGAVGEMWPAHPSMGRPSELCYRRAGGCGVSNRVKRFDSIDHTALMDWVRRRVTDKRVLALVKAFLKAGVMTETGVPENSETGTPQGGILSPLLANIALTALDEHLMRPWKPAPRASGPPSKPTAEHASYAWRSQALIRIEELRYQVQRIRCHAGEDRQAPDTEPRAPGDTASAPQRLAATADCCTADYISATLDEAELNCWAPAPQCWSVRPRCPEFAALRAHMLYRS